MSWTPTILGRAITDRDTNKVKPKECYKCGGKGHCAMVCPTREQRISLACKASHTDVDTSHPEIEEVSKETPEEVLEGSTPPLYVIRRVLTSHKRKDAVEED